ncbi:MAG TPA: DUF4124 domain-containing protein [Burkholderiales bacterium]|jgi:hypothetical protein
MTRSILALAMAFALAAGTARADIWECVDETGNKRFTNIRSEAKGCRLLHVSPLNTVPATKPQARATATPPGFPRVDGETQRQRDADRRRILEQELASEQKLLEKARSELAVQDSMRLGSERNYQRVLDRLEPYQRKVKLHEDNISNLRRELAGGR